MKQYVICIGMKRSGSTLQYNIVKQLLSKSGVVEAEGYVSGVDLHDLIRSTRESSQSVDSSYVVKCHNPPLGLSDEIDSRVIFVYRDIRAVYLSCKIKWGIELEQFIKNTDEVLKIYEHYQASKNVLVQRYESLYSDRAAAIKEINQYLDLNLLDEELQCVFEATSIESIERSSRNRFGFVSKAQHRINKMSSAIPKDILLLFRKIGIISMVRRYMPREVFVADTLVHINHFSPSKGRPDEWRTMLKQYEQDRLSTHYRDWLIQHDYSKG